jgi:hypothetical protein
MRFKTVRYKQMKKLRINRFDLLGNEQDGFDNNNTLHCGTEEINDNYGDAALRKWVLKYFVGADYNIKEASDHYMVAKDISVVWEEPGIYDAFAIIEYRGQPVGELIVE